MSKAFGTLIFLIGASTVVAEDSEATRIAAATGVLTEITKDKDKGIPEDLFHKAHCAVVIPGLKKAGFIFSAKYGRGFASCRQSGGGWSAPAAMRVEGGGFGLQAGGAAVDIVMLVMSDKGMKGILASKFTLGADASVAAGPVGREATAQTDATTQADILSWSRAKGVFGGLALEGGTLRVDDDGNKEIYGRPETGTAILTGNVKPTSQTTDLMNALVQCGGNERTR
jgi:lipid-binding SYLF domain-containing protein